MHASYGTLCSIFYDVTKNYASLREVDFYASFAQPGSQTRILEAMSGSGRLQIPLMMRGYAVDGVDNSAIMLDRCRQRCAHLGLTPTVYQQSLEALQLPHQYDVITIAVGSFQLLADRAVAVKALQNLHAHLADDGVLLIDIFTPDVTADPRSIRIATIDASTQIKLTTRYVFDVPAKIADAFCTYELLVNNNITQTEQELIKVTWYSDEEFIQLLADAGFQLVAFHDESFRENIASRIVQAQKKR